MIYTIQPTEGIKAKLWSILKDGIEIVRSLSKVKASLLINELNQITKDLNHDKSTIDDRCLQIRQRDESVDSSTACGAISGETNGCSSIVDTEERGTTVLPEPQAGGVCVDSPSSIQKQDSNTCKPLPDFVQNNLRETTEEFTGYITKSTENVLKLAAIADFAIDLAGAVHDKHVEFDDSITASRVHSIEPTTIEVEAE